MVSVLYVDDEANLLELTKLFLEFRGEFSVDTRTSAQDGLDLLRSRTYDAIVSDYQMPGLDGIDFLERVRSDFGDLPFILFTGKGNEDVAARAIESGVDFYVQKGEDPRQKISELGQKIQKAVQRKHGKIVPHGADLRIADLISFLSDATVVIDKNGAVIAWNRAIEEMTGVAAGDILGKDKREYARALYGEPCPVLIDAVFNPEAKIQEGYSGPVLRDGDIVVAETQMAGPDGLFRTVSCRAMPLRDDKGSVIGAIESIRDSTKSLQADPATQGNWDNLLFFNNMDEGAAYSEIVFDADNRARDYRVLAVNKSFELKLGIRQADLIGKTGSEAFKTFPPPYLELFARVADTGKPEVFEAAASPLDKQFRISVYSPRKNQFAAIFYDITERKLAEAALQKANHQLNLLTTITRHDILNKVSAIIGHLDIMRMKFPNPALAQYIGRLDDTARAIQGLLADTQMYQDLGSHEPQWQDPEKLIKHLTVPEAIALVPDLPATEIYADPMLEKIFFNLLDNSLRHGMKVTRIRVLSRQTEDGLVLTWEDDGIGVKTQMKEQIFKRGVGKNTGLGLFLAREILALTGITIRENGTEGEGARFEIKVPKGAYRLSLKEKPVVKTPVLLSDT